MDHDKLVEELQRLQEWLSKHDPTNEQYETVLDRFIKLARFETEYNEACDKLCERADKSSDAEDRRKMEKRQAWWDLIKIFATTTFSTVCSAALIVVTGKIEQNAILGQHQWQLIPKLKR